MKKILLFLMLLAALFPVFSSWEIKTREVKDEFGDVTSKDDYYINGSWNNRQTDKYILFFINNDEFCNGFMSFGEKGSKSNETYVATIKIKEQDGTVKSYTCSGETISNTSYWCCTISIDFLTAKEMIEIFTRNDSVKVSVTYGKAKEIYNYGTVDSADFINSPICMKLGHKYDGGVVSVNPTCMTEGTRTFTCLNCGSTQKKTISALGHDFVNNECTRCVVGHKGQAGGIIFYDCDADNDVGNPDGLKSSECGWEFLEAWNHDLRLTFSNGNECENFPFGFYRLAPEDDNRFVSGYSKYDEASCTLTAIGTGKRNTELLVEAMGADAFCYATGDVKIVNYAAGLVARYNSLYPDPGDWFLPSKDELNLMYINLGKYGLGDFSDYYWSSSESSQSSFFYDGVTLVWCQMLSSGYSCIECRDEAYHIRPIRAY